MVFHSVLFLQGSREEKEDEGILGEYSSGTKITPTASMFVTVRGFMTIKEIIIMTTSTIHPEEMPKQSPLPVQRSLQVQAFHLFLLMSSTDALSSYFFICRAERKRTGLFRQREMSEPKGIYYPGVLGKACMNPQTSFLYSAELL